jgi:hypothetical protein
MNRRTAFRGYCEAKGQVRRAGRRSFFFCDWCVWLVALPGSFPENDVVIAGLVQSGAAKPSGAGTPSHHQSFFRS